MAKLKGSYEITRTGKRESMFSVRGAWYRSHDRLRYLQYIANTKSPVLIVRVQKIVMCNLLHENHRVIFTSKQGELQFIAAQGDEEENAKTIFSS